jgi:hypothetical protein
MRIGVDLVHAAAVHSYHEVHAEGANQEVALANLALNLGKEVLEMR